MERKTKQKPVKRGGGEERKRKVGGGEQKRKKRGKKWTGKGKADKLLFHRQTHS